MLVHLRSAGAPELARSWGDFTTHQTPDLTLWEHPDTWLTEDVSSDLGTRSLDAIATPGHTQGHYVYADPAAGLFLLAELVAAQRGDAAGDLVPASPLAQPTLLGVLMLLAAASAAALPPLPGFIGKLMLLEASTEHTWQVAIWATVLGVGFLTLIGLARAGSILFWNVRTDLPAPGSAGMSPKLIGATLLLLATTVAMSVFAAPIQRYTAAAAEQLADRGAYARAVLGARGEATDSARPYDGTSGGPR